MSFLVFSGISVDLFCLPEKEVLKFTRMSARYNPVLLDFDNSFEDHSEDPQDDRGFFSNNLFKSETSSDPCEVVTSANAKLPPLNPSTADIQNSLEEKMKQERREFEMALNQKLKMAPSGLFTYSISFILLFVKQSFICLAGILMTPH